MIQATRLLHFTDMHLRWHQPGSAANPKRLSRDMPSALDRLAGKIKALAPEILVMSGDILDMPDAVIAGGTPDNRPHDSWMADASADFQLVKDWFESTGVPYVIVPGNHDDEGAFAELFGGPQDPRDIAGLRFFSFWDQLAADRQPHRIGARRAQFARALGAREHDCGQVHVQHYMIDPPIFAKGWHYQYKDAAGMKREVARSGRVRAVLSGHYHPGSLVADGGAIYSVAPAFCEAPHAFRIYDIEPNGIDVTDHALDD